MRTFEEKTGLVYYATYILTFMIAVVAYFGYGEIVAGIFPLMVYGGLLYMKGAAVGHMRKRSLDFDDEVAGETLQTYGNVSCSLAFGVAVAAIIGGWQSYGMDVRLWVSSGIAFSVLGPIGESFISLGLSSALTNRLRHLQVRLAAAELRREGYSDSRRPGMTAGYGRAVPDVATAALLGFFRNLEEAARGAATSTQSLNTNVQAASAEAAKGEELWRNLIGQVEAAGKVMEALDSLLPRRAAVATPDGRGHATA